MTMILTNNPVISNRVAVVSTYFRLIIIVAIIKWWIFLPITILQIIIIMKLVKIIMRWIIKNWVWMRI